MAYFTYFSTPQRALTEEEIAQQDSYISAQVSAGTTDGEKYQWTFNVSGEPTIRSVRMWGTSESANGYKSLFAGFSPAFPVSVF